MRLLILTRSLGAGGAERQVSLLAPPLSRRGHEVSVAIWRPGGVFHDRLEAAGIAVHEIPASPRAGIARFLRCLCSLVDRVGPDIIYSIMPTANIFSGTLRALRRRVSCAWGIVTADLRADLLSPLERAVYRVEALFSRTPDVVIVNSRAGLAGMAERGFRCANACVVPNGYDLDLFRRDEAAGLALRSAWGITPGQRLVGRVGRFDPLKDYPTFLEAAAMVAAARSDARFVCAGGGPPPLEKELRRQARTLGIGDRLRWVGARPDMPAVYSALDLLCSSSVTEGFPNVVGEAMACEVPCVVTDVGDSSWLVGDTGTVVPASDPATLASGILSRLDDGRSASARARVERHFGLEDLVTRTETALLSARPVHDKARARSVS